MTTWSALLSEWLREVSALVAVFGLLDKLVSGGAVPARWAALTATLSVVTFVAGGILAKRGQP